MTTGTGADGLDLRDSALVDVGAGRLDVAVCGPEEGPTAVLLHGFPGSRATFALVAPLLVARGLRVVAPDQRGYSPQLRPGEVSDYHVEHLVADVIGLLDALGLDEVDLVGHDWGAVVGWAVAAWHPDRLRSLTAISVPHPAALARARAQDPEQQEGSRYIDLLTIPGKAERVLLEDDARRLRGFYTALSPTEVPAGLAERHVQRLTEPGALTGALGWYRAVDDVLDELPPVTVDTTLVWGVRDAAIRRAAVADCRAYVTGSYRLLELPWAGHWVPESDAHLVAAEVLRHVEGTTGSW